MQDEHYHSQDFNQILAQLAQLDWTRGLTRNDLKASSPSFPRELYLRLPDSKRFHSPAEVLRTAWLAPSRAEGDFLGAGPNIPANRSVEEGGPPAWGESPLVTPGGTIDSGSAEDREEPAP
jgi:hypothetical protein